LLEDPPPRVRADVERNRRRLLDAALAAFSADGGADVPLESIARDAGVGIGTLYRHFPSREALVEAVYRDELTTLCGRAAPLLARHSPDRALRLWMGRYAEFVSTKRGMAEALRAVIGSGAISSAQTRATLGEAVALLLAAGSRDGSLRGDVAAADVVASFAGVLLAAADRRQAERMLDLLVDGLRPRD
jgi:AcrR family transcriptional regulator